MKWMGLWDLCLSPLDGKPFLGVRYETPATTYGLFPEFLAWVDRCGGPNGICLVGAFTRKLGGTTQATLCFRQAEMLTPTDEDITDV